MVKVATDKQELFNEIGVSNLKLVVDKRDFSRLTTEAKNITTSTTNKKQALYCGAMASC